MSVQEIVELVGLGVTIIALIVSIIVAIVKGNLKDFITEKMKEAEASDKSGKEKLEYVIKAVKEKYKLATLLIDVREFIEKIIDITKNINSK
jgi:K+-sensing histidine kinase KdpD